MPEEPIKIALLQTSAKSSKEENLHRMGSLISEAAENGANIICLQELFLSTYFCQTIDDANFRLSEAVPGPTTDKLSVLAKKLGVVLTVPIFERHAPGIYYNTVAVLDADGAYLGKYRKMHIPEDPGFHEKYYFTPGDLGYKVFKTLFGNIGVLICYDQWFPEAARQTALQGADILIYPTAIGSLPYENETVEQEYLTAWKTIQQSHAIANGCFVATTNRTGIENDIDFWGHSFICSPIGKILSEAGSGEEIVYADCDISSIEKHRQTWPFFRDRRIDSYGQ
ncbi:MAG: carbon-nitrogen hydrolase [Balneolales bacterium]